VIEVEIWLWMAGVVVFTGLVGGVILADRLLAHRGRALDAREAKLHAEWEALRKSQRLQVAFMAARRAMAEEAIRQARGNPRHG